MFIKKLAILLISALLFTGGCKSVPVERGVSAGNVFTSSSMPETSIGIGPDLAFIGKSTNSRYPVGPGNHDTTPLVYESYLFGNVERELYIKKGIAITVVKSSEKPFPKDLFDKNTYYIKRGIKKIQGKTYQNAVYVITEETELSGIPAKTADYLDDQGYFMPGKYLVSTCGRTFGKQKNQAFFITYFEDYARFKQDGDKESMLQQVDIRVSRAIRPR